MNELVQTEPRIVAFDPMRKQLADLAAENKSLVFDYESPEGNRAARSQVYALRQTKAAVEKIRKAEKSSVLELGRMIDAEAKDITGEIEAMIEVHNGPLQEIEQREAQRIAEIQRRLQTIRDLGVVGQDDTSERVAAALAEVQAMDASSGFDEFEADAKQLIWNVTEHLSAQVEGLTMREAEKAELARLRREAEEREEAERQAQAEAAAKADAEKRAREQAEREAREAREAQERAEQERRDAEARAEAAERAAAEAQAREKAEAERREREAAEAEERERKAIEAAEKEEQRQKKLALERSEQIRREIYEELAKVVASEHAYELADLLIAGRIPHVTITI